MGLIGLTLLLAQMPVGDDFYQDFRGMGAIPEFFEVMGQDAATLVKPEPEGVRITLPAERRIASAVGFRLRFPIKGDFEVTTRYEILRADPPAAGFGNGFSVYIAADTPSKDAMEFFHVLRRGGNEDYGCVVLTTQPDGRRTAVPVPEIRDPATTGLAGQMRITRIGTELILSVAKAEGDAFRELNRFGFSTADVAMVRLAAQPGNAPNPADVRVRDFRLRLKGIVPTPSEAPPGSRTYLYLLLVLMVTFSLSAFLIWLYRRRAEKA